MNNTQTTYFVYFAVFLSEFSFFFSLPLLGKSPDLSASSVAACLAGAIILESILMLISTGYLERLSRRKLIFTSLALRSVAFLAILLSLSLYSWLMFFLLISVSKSISKPFLREILAGNLSGESLKKAMNTYSLFQNSAVFVAPSLAAIALTYGFINYVILLVIISGIVMATMALTISYATPSNKKSGSGSPFVSLGYIFRGGMAGAVQRILLASFFCFLIMGVFITSTTLLGKINPELRNYSGLFFSVVGATICLWQGGAAKLSFIRDKWTSHLIVAGGVIASLYLTGSLYIAVAALIAYSIYESVIIPEIYVVASGIHSAIPSGVLFSYIVVMSNIGSAFGSWITGLAITYFNDYVPMLILITVFLSSIFSFILLKTTHHKEVQCQS